MTRDLLLGVLAAAVGVFLTNSLWSHEQFDRAGHLFFGAICMIVWIAIANNKESL